MKIRYIKIIVSALLLQLSIVSCESWLDIKPEDRVTEEQLFSDLSGFKIALNGIYSEMNSATLYGGDLGNGMLDVMAQYYNCNIESHPYRSAISYSYTESSLESRLSSIWSRMYFLIANTNLLLENCELQNGVLSDKNYNLIKGEALALRAMFHFDLLRMFGPVWSEDTKGMQCMPYMKSSAKIVQPLISADSILNNVFVDLNNAEQLLKQVDPILLSGDKEENTQYKDSWMSYRPFRLNYYAVNALLARAYHWKGDRVNAFKYANYIISNTSTDENVVFPFVTINYVQNVGDFMFLPEVIFGCYNSSRLNIFKNRFEASAGATNSLRPAGDNIAVGRVSTMYDDLNDVRYSMWIENAVDGTNRVVLLKLRQQSSTNSIDRTFANAVLPLIRISEMYLIAAECTDNISESYRFLNALRYGRQAVDLTVEDDSFKQKHIQAEYIKEFIGEGQLFFYFKRLGLDNIPDGQTVDKMMNMDLNNYVFPIPKSETDQRVD